MLCAAAACLILAIGLVIARRYYLDHLPEQVQSPAAAAAVFDTLVRFLRVSIRTAIVLGIVVALGAYLSGSRGRRAGYGARRNAPRTPPPGGAPPTACTPGGPATRVEANRRWITTGVLLVIALVFALWNHPTVLTVLLLVLILLAVLAVLALLAAAWPPEHEDGAPGGPVARRRLRGDHQKGP